MWVTEQTVPSRSPILARMSHLLRLIYASRSAVPIDAPALDVLVSESRSRNEEADINGILCFGRGYFVQALEGPEAPVMSLYGRLLRDTRHQQCVLLSIGLVSSRVFPHWAMALVEGNPVGPELRTRLVDRVLLDRDPSDTVKLLQDTLKSLRKAS
jgi:hypothetical protein